MQFIDIKNSIQNAIEISRITGDVNRVKLDARDGLVPSTEKAKDIFERRCDSPMSTQLIKDICAQNRKVKPDTIFAQINKAATVIANEAELLEKFLVDDARTIVMREALNVRDANILEFIAVSDYFLAITRTFLIAINDLELSHLRGEKLDTAIAKHLNDIFKRENIKSFADCIAFYNQHDDGKLIETITDLPEIRVDPQIITTVQSTEGRKAIDPAGFNPLNIINPVAWSYVAGKTWSEIKLYRLSLNTEELEYLELRYQEILLSRNDKRNPQLERQIERYADTIQITRTKIKRLQASMG